MLQPYRLPQVPVGKQTLRRSVRSSFCISFRCRTGRDRFGRPSGPRGRVAGELPDRESFAHVDDLMGGLANLSPRRVQRLLEACHSIKAKRLFLFMADRHNHAWFKRLDMSRIDLGSGKRSFVEGGRYDPKYRITVPETLVSSADDV